MLAPNAEVSMYPCLFRLDVIRLQAVRNQLPDPPTKKISFVGSACGCIRSVIRRVKNGIVDRPGFWCLITMVLDKLSAPVADRTGRHLQAPDDDLLYAPSAHAIMISRAVPVVSVSALTGH